MHTQENVSLLSYNTLQVECIARYFVEIATISELQKLVTIDIFKNHDHLIIGWWSNILLTSSHYDGIVIKNNILGKEIIEEDDETVTIKVGAGENWNTFVEWTLEQWYCWLENLISIPWSVGAAPMQNIWAYGVEAKSSIQDVELIELEAWELKSISNNECDFWYRSSIFKAELKNKVFISHVTFALSKYSAESYEPNITYGAIQEQLEKQWIQQPTPKQVADIVRNIRASKLPDRTKIWTAGSFFKNPIIEQDLYEQLKKNYPNLITFPVEDTNSLKSEIGNRKSKVKLSAGQLIDLTGLKWLTQWNVGTYKNHALILVNHGWGTWTQIEQLAKHIQEKVFKKFGVQLEPEVNYV